MIKKILKDHQIRMQIVSIAGGNVAAIVNFIINLLVARNLIVSDYGQYGAINALPQIFYSIFSFVSYSVINLMSGAFYDESKSNFELRSLFERFSILSVLWTFLLVLFSPFISVFFNIDVNYLILLFLTLCLMNFLNFITSYYQGKGLFAISSAKEITLSVLKLCLIYLLFSNGFKSLWVPMTVELVAVVIILVPMWKLSNSKSLFLFTSWTETAKKSFRLLFDSKQSIFSVFVMGIVMSNDILIAKKILSSFESGIIIAGLSLSKVLIFFSGPINMVLYFFSVRETSSNRNKIKIFMRSLLFTFVGTLFLGSIMSYFKIELISGLYGNKYSALIEYFDSLIIYSGFSAINLLVINFLISRNTFRFCYRILILYFLVITFILNIKSSNFFSIDNIIMIYLVNSVLIFIFLFFEVVEYFFFPKSRYLL